MYTTAADDDSAAKHISCPVHISNGTGLFPSWFYYSISVGCPNSLGPGIISY